VAPHDELLAGRNAAILEVVAVGSIPRAAHDIVVVVKGDRVLGADEDRLVAESMVMGVANGLVVVVALNVQCSAGAVGVLEDLDVIGHARCGSLRACRGRGANKRKDTEIKLDVHCGALAGGGEDGSDGELEQAGILSLLYWEATDSTFLTLCITQP